MQWEGGYGGRGRGAMDMEASTRNRGLGAWANGVAWEGSVGRDLGLDARTRLLTRAVVVRGSRLITMSVVSGFV